MKKTLIVAAMLSMSLLTFAQKKPLDHSVYDGWKSISGVNTTNDGKYSVFQVNAQEGDGYLVFLNNLNLSKDSIARGSSARVTENDKYAVFTIKPLFAQTKAAKLKKAKPDQMPKDTLAIYNITTKEIKKISHLKGFKMGRWAKNHVAFQTTPPADTAKSKKPVKKDKDEGSDLMVYSFTSGRTDTLKFVSDYEFSRGGDTLFYALRPNSKDSVNKAGLYMYIPVTGVKTALFNHDLKQSVKLPEVSEDNGKMVFFAKLDTTKKNKDKYISVLEYRATYPQAKVIIDNSLAGIPQGMIISENRSLQFNKQGTRLFFGIAPVMAEKDTTVADSEVAKLDIWHYAEPYNQPMQLLNLSRELKKSFLSKIELDGEKSFVQLGREEFSPVVTKDWSSDIAYAVSDYEYRLESQWSANPRRDLYVIDVKTGKATKVVTDKYMSNVTASPDGNFLAWYNNAEKQWYTYEFATGNNVNITKGLNVSFADELHDSPSMASSYGHGGWAEGDKAIFVYDRYDIWQLDPKGAAPAVNFTDGIGRAERKTFRITDPENTVSMPMAMRGMGGPSEAVSLKKTIYFTAFDNVSKNNGYYYKDLSKKKPVLSKWVLEPMTFSSISKVKNMNTVAYVKGNFTTSPEVWITKDNFKTQTRITDINPQQRDYNWGTVELVKWTSATGIELEGLLYKPENFDPAKKYPMIAYFYERNSELLHAYRAPAPSRSTINIPYFVSNEYIVFVPDIAYEIGHPGKSAIDCIVPGVKMLCQNSWIDSENVAIQGQSWGGYQVAYMVTQPQTFKWKAAGAGAPVANMTSAYGGIRWGSGMVRQFQYEHTQSRIGKTPWEALDLYIENSPLFFADKVETPLLIMHNDADDAVPWYQGIEYFTALKRLGKPAWLLQYNKEVHNLAGRVNAKDLSIRLAQFFDHYLKGAPMPVWMKYGVPATSKGIDWGYELVK